MAKPRKSLLQGPKARSKRLSRDSVVASATRPESGRARQDKEDSNFECKESTNISGPSRRLLIRVELDTKLGVGQSQAMLKDERFRIKLRKHSGDKRTKH